MPILTTDRVSLVLVDELDMVEAKQTEAKLLDRDKFDADRAHESLHCSRSKCRAGGPIWAACERFPLKLQCPFQERLLECDGSHQQAIERKDTI